MDFWRTKKFKIISIEWNQKLKDSEFDDAESQSCGDTVLKQRATNSYRQANSLERETRLDYYLLIGHLANNTQFPSFIEETIMLCHSEGKTIKEIIEELGAKGLSRSKKTIIFIIRRWHMEWGIRHWTHKQMNLKRHTG